MEQVIQNRHLNFEMSVLLIRLNTQMIYKRH